MWPVGAPLLTDHGPSNTKDHVLAVHPLAAAELFQPARATPDAPAGGAAGAGGQQRLSFAPAPRDFSQVALLTSPLRRSLKLTTVERKLFLKLNRAFWSPIPELANDPVMQRHRAAALPAPAAPEEAGSDDSADECED